MLITDARYSIERALLALAQGGSSGVLALITQLFAILNNATETLLAVTQGPGGVGVAEAVTAPPMTAVQLTGALTSMFEVNAQATVGNAAQGLNTFQLYRDATGVTGGTPIGPSILVESDAVGFKAAAAISYIDTTDFLPHTYSLRVTPAGTATIVGGVAGTSQASISVKQL